MPNRILKESICTSDTLDQLTSFQETFFYRLLVNCDDFGRFDARPVVLKSRLFPLKDDLRLSLIEDALRKLCSLGTIMRYEVGGKSFLQIEAWDRHQCVRAKKSKYPAPKETESFLQQNQANDGRLQASASNCMQMQADEINGMQMSPYSYSESYSESESEAGDAREDAPAAPAASCVAYCETCLRSMSPGNYEELKSFMEQDGLTDDLIRHAIDDACGHGNRSWSYVAKILSRYVVEGIRTVEQAKATSKPKPQGGHMDQGRTGKVLSATAYAQRNYADDHEQPDAWLLEELKGASP